MLRLLLAILLLSMPAVVLAQSEPPAPPPTLSAVPRVDAQHVFQAGSQLPTFLSGDIRPADYPAAAYLEGREGTTNYEIDVSAEGAITACRVVGSSGHADLDALTCSLLPERLRFRPDMVRAGQAVAGTYRASQRWRKRASEYEPSSLDASMTIDADGKVTSCRFDEASGRFADMLRRESERDPCAALFRENAPLRDSAGNPVARTLRIRASVEITEPAADENVPQ